MPTARLTALRHALTLEADGMAYYRQARDQATSGIGQQMFEFLRRSEEDHIRAIKQLYHALEETGDWPSQQPGLTDTAASHENIFSRALQEIAAGILPADDDLQALHLAAEFERRGEDFYQQRASDCEDIFEKSFYHNLALEEAGHLRNIEEAIELLENPDGFFMQREAGARSL